MEDLILKAFTHQIMVTKVEEAKKQERKQEIKNKKEERQTERKGKNSDGYNKFFQIK